MKFILGKKIEMTQIWKGDDVIAVTKISAGPCPVVQVKNDAKDGYQAMQIGFGVKKVKNIRKPQLGHLAKVSAQGEKKVNIRTLREFRVEGSSLHIGDIIDVTSFAVGDIIDVIGISKGKGFQGVVKRYHFHGQDKTHGHKDQERMPGSIGSTTPQRVFKGTRMGGRMGNDRVTMKNLEVIEIDKENNFLYIKGGVPGARNGLLLISGEGEMTPIKAGAEVVKEEVKVEAPIVEEIKAEEVKVE